MLKHVYVHNVFMYAVYFDATYTRQIYVLCTHDTFIHTPGFDFGAWENHEVHTERAALENQSFIVPQTQSM